MPYAVIMAGGKGERFWPKSRRDIPKQLLTVKGNQTLLQATLERAKKIFSEENIFCIINERYFEKVKEQIPLLKDTNIINEPESRNTAACVALAAFLLSKHGGKDEVMLVLPADHIITDNRKFSQTIKTAVNLAGKSDFIVTVGIKPTYPSTQYGYIKLKPLSLSKNVYKVEKFVEKPNKQKAAKFLKENLYLWNAGIFAFRISVMLEAFKKHMPKLYKQMKKITSHYPSPLKKEYAKIEKISIDYGIMEKISNIAVVKADFEWEDTGNWLSLERILKQDNKQNTIIGNFYGIDTSNSIIVSDTNHLVSTIGVSNLIIAHTDDATLVCDKNNTEQIRMLVNKLAESKRYKKYV